YELLFLAYVGFVLYRIGYNFFYESLLNREAILSTDFYVPAAVFLLLWTGLLVILFTRRLRRGLEKQIDNLAAELVERKLAGGLFPELQQLCDETARQRDRLEQLGERAEELRREIAGPAQLGVSRPPLETSAR